MNNNHSLHQAHYDADGNIILGRAEPSLDHLFGEEGQPVHVHAKNDPVEALVPVRTTRKNDWNVTHEDAPKKKEVPKVQKSENMPKTVAETPKKQHPSAIRTLYKNTGSLVSAALTEGKKQIAATAENATKDMKDAGDKLGTVPARTRGILKKFWNAASAPVEFPGKKSKRKKTKLELFVVDTVRFGGTFAGIFTVLFVGINYQSFFQIAKAELALGGDIQTEQALEQMVRGTLDAPKAKAATNSVLQSEGNVLAYLPEVGPFEDRLVIPKIGKNVPIVRPSMDALMKEDWKQFEVDIQAALHDGVVHYPGSARPGQAGNFFLTGHSSYYPWDDGQYKDVFARLGELQLGDTYSVYYGGDKHTYRITEKKEVKPSDVSVLDQPTNKRFATLMTCTPVGTTLRRLILIAEEIDPQTGDTLAVGEKVDETKGNALKRLEALPI